MTARSLALVLSLAAAGASLPAQSVTVRPYVTRLDWRTANFVAFADRANGAHLWASTTRAVGPELQRGFVGRYEPGAVELWGERVRQVLRAEKPDAGDTSSVLQAVLLATDGSITAIARRRLGSRWERETFIYLADAQRTAPIVVRGTRDNARDFANALQLAAGLSQVNVDSSAREAFVNPIDTANCVLLLPGASAPVYPPALRDRGKRGEVWLSFVVDTSGTVDMNSVDVVWSDDPLFTESVKAALTKYRFRPALVGGRPAVARAYQRFNFTLE